MMILKWLNTVVAERYHQIRYCSVSSKRKYDTVLKWLLSLLKGIIKRQRRHLLPLKLGWWYILRLILFITEMYHQVVARFGKKFYLFLLKMGNFSQRRFFFWKFRQNIFCDMNFQMLYRIFISDVIIIKFLWSEILWIYRIMWKS